MHNEKEQEMTSPVSHSEDAQSTMQGKSWGVVALSSPTTERSITAQQIGPRPTLPESLPGP